MAPKPTPEEKLFAVIQGARASHPRARAQALGLPAPLARWVARLGTLDLDRANQLLLGAAGLLVLLCVLQPLVLRPHVGRLLAEARTQGVPFIMPPPLEGLRPVEEAVQVMQAQNPFRVTDATLRAPSPTPAAAPAAPSPQELLSQLRLVGIAWSDDPTAMIEDGSGGGTHFLKAGQAVGPFTIQEILEDRVILLYQSQEIELF